MNLSIFTDTIITIQFIFWNFIGNITSEFANTGLDLDTFIKIHLFWKIFDNLFEIISF